MANFDLKILIHVVFIKNYHILFIELTKIVDFSLAY